MFKTANFLMLTAGMLLALLATPSSGFAQAPQLKEHQKAIALVDARVAMMIKEAAAEGLDAEAMDQLPMEGPFEGIKLSQLERVYGAVSLPESLDGAMQQMMTGGPPPVDFFIRLKFTEADFVEKFEENMKQISEQTTVGGQEYWTPRGAESGMFLGRRIDETSFELGTPDYVQQAKRNFFTDRLKAAFKSAPDEALRVVLDLETRRDFFQSAKKQFGGNLDPVSQAYLDLIDNAKSLVITSSWSSENLLSLLAEANDEADAEELADGLDGLLGTAKLGFGMMAGQMGQGMPPEAQGSMKMVKGIVDSLAATKSGTTVKVLVKKPEGFGAEMTKLQALMAVQAKKASRLNDFRQLALASLNYESAFRKFPFQTDGSHPSISWRAKVLPFIEENEMYDQMSMDSSANEDPNSSFADKMPVVFGTDGKLSTVSWIKSDVKGFGDITDGSSNTIMLIENPKGRPWIENNPLTPDEAVKLVKGLGDGESLAACFCDGSARMLTKDISEETLKNLFNPTDGNRITDFR